MLVNTKKPWMAQMQEIGKKIAHMVVVDGIDEVGFVLIRDPWQGTSYKMELNEFLKFWSQIGVF